MDPSEYSVNWIPSISASCREYSDASSLRALFQASKWASLTRRIAACTVSRRLFKPSSSWWYFSLDPQFRNKPNLSAKSSSFTVMSPPSP